jgi:hypothetical protein
VCGADDGLELPDLAGEDGVPDAELASRVLDAGLSGKGEEPSDALLGAQVGEDVPDVRGERARPAEGGEWVGTATALRYARETIALLAPRAPKLGDALGAARKAGTRSWSSTAPSSPSTGSPPTGRSTPASTAATA